jgi:serine/threonine protein kinase
MANYTLLQTLGRGAFGRVERAQSDTGAVVALKFFEPSQNVANAVAAGHVSLDELKKRFISEATYQARINHPNVIKVFDSNLASVPPFFVMELAEATLAQDLAFDHTLNGAPHQALFDILAGLEGIHGQGIYHRDLKPQNILRVKNADGTHRYALSDFGLMKIATGEATTLTATGAQGGTERYAAPELISNFKRATARSDIFSFGVILFDIFVGPLARVPYTEVQINGPIGVVAAKCTKTLPARRYASIAELRSALYEALQSAPPNFGSPREEQLVDLLRSGNQLSEQDWDRIFLLLDELAPFKVANDLILRSFSKAHIEALSNEAPDLLAAFASYYTDYVSSNRGRFDFDYCDVVGDKLAWIFEFGDVATKAHVLLVMLGLGVSHNRWFVERRFMELAGPTLELAVAERFILDVDVAGLGAVVLSDIAHLERSISTQRSLLSPALHRLWGG